MAAPLQPWQQRDCQLGCHHGARDRCGGASGPREVHLTVGHEPLGEAAVADAGHEVLVHEGDLQPARVGERLGEQVHGRQRRGQVGDQGAGVAGGDEGADLWTWIFTNLFFDQKFYSIFSMLFGAGVILMTRRAEEKGVKFGKIYYRRILWLLLFGLLHGYFLWSGARFWIGLA